MNPIALQHLIDGNPLLGYAEGGNSMTPIIASREPVDIYPVDPKKVSIGDIVVARVKGRIWCHLVSATDADRVQISNNHGHINGWTHRSKVYGIVTHVSGVERAGTRGKIR